jgi:hypothetical protein
MTKFARSDEPNGESMPNQIQSLNCENVWILEFDIHLTFACLPVGRDFEI